MKEDGIPIVEVILNDLRSTGTFGVKFPHSIEVLARDEKNRVALKAVFTVTTLKINEPVAEKLFAPNFEGAERFWDSDAKGFTEQ